ncbi:MAG: glycine cleavage system protein GcvH [Thermoplasmata archaeon]
MEYEGYNFPDELRYHEEHCWARVEGDVVVVGLTEFVIVQAGDIVHIKSLEVGDEVEKDKQFASIETGKYVGKLYSPVSGRIEEVNEEVLDEPMLIEESPYENGWIIKVKPSDLSEIEKLMTVKEIPGFIGKKIAELKEKNLYKEKKKR